ncbi:uncharacterized protein LOC143762310 [Ranitomeya variabilis]|uniref:uncharacterized protein LOC143762310 n=1 Tax=Ranitomeya variabilis TaxID=490064 RepID=UPI0040578E3B
MQYKPGLYHLKTVNSQKIVKMVSGPIIKAIVSDSSTDSTEDVCELVYSEQKIIPGTVQKREAALLLQHQGLKYQMRYTEKNEMSTELEFVETNTQAYKRLEDCLFILVSMGDQKYKFQCKAKPELYLCVQGENGGNEVQLREPDQQHETIFQIYLADVHVQSNGDAKMIDPNGQRRREAIVSRRPTEKMAIPEKKTETRRAEIEYALENPEREYRYQTRSVTRKNSAKIKITYTTFSEEVTIIEKKGKCALENPEREYRYQTRSSARKNSAKIKTTCTTFLEEVNIIEKKRKCAPENPKREYRYQTRSLARKNSPKIKNRK